MATLFTKIIDGEIPARFVWQDDRCVAFLTIAPLATGHTLVVPRKEVDHWIEADDDLLSHLLAVAKAIGAAQQEIFEPVRIGMMIAGLEVPHLHIHVVPMNSVHDLDFARADHNPNPDELENAAMRLKEALEGVEL